MADAASQVCPSILRHIRVTTRRYLLFPNQASRNNPMNGILPVEKKRTTASAQFVANPLTPHTKSSMQPLAEGKIGCSIRSLLFTQGFGRTLEYFCTISAFSIG
jgi:hypothetical protein